MDLAYDRIQEEAFAENISEAKNGSAPEQSSQQQPQEQQQGGSQQRGTHSQQPSLNSDLQDAYKAFSTSPWGIKIGGFLGNVMKQGESVYNQASKELAEVGEDATKGFNDLRDSLMTQTRSLAINATLAAQTGGTDDNQTTPTRPKNPSDEELSETVLSRLRSEAAKRLHDLQKAEDAADQALLRFGTNVRDFLREAISIAPPEVAGGGSTVLFESKDSSGKRVIHASRYDAQLHVIHTTAESFTNEPSVAEYEQWAKDFDAEKKTADISSDLTKYPELRTTMGKLVPDKVPYAEFWKRYYFLRHGIEAAEARRRDLLKAASAEDEVGWGDDSDDEAAGPGPGPKLTSSASSTTIQPRSQGLLKPIEPRQSNDEKSQADSEASYDVVGATSGKTSQAPSSPKDSRKGDESDDDWE